MSEAEANAATPLLDEALALASAGVPVFACVPDGKTPAVDGGFHAATDDLEQVRAWWTENPDYNIGVPTGAASGHDVLDVDPGGQEALEALEKEHGDIGDTRVVKTPRDGLHIYMKYDAEKPLRNSASKLGPHLDIRGEGGYVLVPPSRVNGRLYTTILDKDIAARPEWITQKLAAAGSIERREAPTGVELDTDANVTRAVVYLKMDRAENGAPVEGQGSDDRAYRIAAKVRGLGISQAKSAELMKGHWSPDFDLDWLEAKTANVGSYAQNEAGADATGLPSETFKNWSKFAKPPVNDNGTVVDSKSRPFRAKSFDEFVDEPEPEWIVQNLIEDRNTVLMLGNSGDFKSTISAGVAGSLVTGHPAFGKLKVNRTGAVAWIAGEDVASIRPRLLAQEREFNISFKGKPFYRVDRMFQVGQREQFDAMVGELEQLGPLALIVWDTLSTAIRGQDENSNGVIGEAIGWAGELRDKFGCSVLILHHRPKAAKKGEANSRGGGAGYNNVDSVILVERSADDELAVELSMPKMRLSSSDALIRLKGKVHETGRRKDGSAVKAVAMVMDEIATSTIDRAQKESARTAKGWRN